MRAGVALGTKAGEEGPACSARWMSGQVMPDPGRWSAVAEAEDRLRAGHAPGRGRMVPGSGRVHGPPPGADRAVRRAITWAARRRRGARPARLPRTCTSSRGRPRGRPRTRGTAPLRPRRRASGCAPPRSVDGVPSSRAAPRLRASVPVTVWRRRPDRARYAARSPAAGPMSGPWCLTCSILPVPPRAAATTERAASPRAAPGEGRRGHASAPGRTARFPPG